MMDDTHTRSMHFIGILRVFLGEATALWALYSIIQVDRFRIRLII
jgi:hypothetical protein